MKIVVKDIKQTNDIVGCGALALMFLFILFPMIITTPEVKRGFLLYWIYTLVGVVFLTAFIYAIKEDKSDPERRVAILNYGKNNALKYFKRKSEFTKAILPFLKNRSQLFLLLELKNLLISTKRDSSKNIIQKIYSDFLSVDSYGGEVNKSSIIVFQGAFSFPFLLILARWDYNYIPAKSESKGAMRSNYNHPEICFESTVFNKIFQVSSYNKMFANQVITVQIMEYLLHSKKNFLSEIILVDSMIIFKFFQQAKIENLELYFNFTQQFYDKIPDFVKEDYTIQGINKKYKRFWF